MPSLISNKAVNKMLKIYKIGNHLYQYEEGEQPEGAVEVKAEEKKVVPQTKIKKQVKNK